MNGYALNEYGKAIVEKNVSLEERTLVNVKVASRIVKYNRFAYSEEEGHNIDNCDRAIIVALPMSKNETAKIYEINNTKEFAIMTFNGKKRRLYSLKNLNLLKEITDSKINKKLYENNSSKYKK